MSLKLEIKALYADALALVQAEGRLVQAEAAEKLKQARRGAVLLGASIMLLLVAAFVLVQSLIDWIATIVGQAPASLLVGCLTLIAGLLLYNAARKRLSPEHLKPHRSLAAARRSVDIVRENTQ